MKEENISQWIECHGGANYKNYRKLCGGDLIVQLMGTVVKPSKKISSWRARYWIIFYKEEYNKVFKTKNITYDLSTAMKFADCYLSKISKLQAFL